MGPFFKTSWLRTPLTRETFFSTVKRERLFQNSPLRTLRLGTFHLHKTAVAKFPFCPVTCWVAFRVVGDSPQFFSPPRFHANAVRKKEEEPLLCPPLNPKQSRF